MEDRIRSALKEIGFCDELKVKIADGEIIAISKQRAFKPARHGIKTEITIESEITNEIKIP